MLSRCALALLVCTAPPAWAQMYKCVDERGVTHYSDKPQPGCKGGKVDIQSSPTLSGEAPGRPTSEERVPSRGSDLSRQDAEFKRRQLERERVEERDKSAVDERCRRLREEYARLASGIRLAKINDKGEREFLDDATRDARLSQVKEQMRGCP